MRTLVLIAVAILLPACLSAQTQAPGTLSGKLTDPAGAAVPNAAVTATNAETGQTATATTGSDGAYRFAMLPPGNYRLKFEAPGFQPLEITSATVGATPAVIDGKLIAIGAAPSPSLGDLGFSPDQSKGSAVDQARLDRRSHMLKIHQRLGLITTAPLVATLFAANGAAGRKGTASGRELHAVLGSVTAGMYLTTASFAIFAPKVAGTPARGSIRLHKALAWIHGPGMILTPILGALAYQQRDRGEKVHGIASAHGAVAGVTAVAYGAAMLSVMIKF
jgi:hypothetical protein